MAPESEPVTVGEQRKRSFKDFGVLSHELVLGLPGAAPCQGTQVEAERHKLQQLHQFHWSGCKSGTQLQTHFPSNPAEMNVKSCQFVH